MAKNQGQRGGAKEPAKPEQQTGDPTTGVTFTPGAAEKPTPGNAGAQEGKEIPTCDHCVLRFVEPPEGLPGNGVYLHAEDCPTLKGCEFCKWTREPGVDSVLMHAADCPTLTEGAGLPPPPVEGKETTGAPASTQSAEEFIQELVNYETGRYIVVKKDQFAALIHDLVRGYTQAWTGAGAKNKLLLMIAGVEPGEQEDAYQHLKAHDIACDLKEDTARENS